MTDDPREAATTAARPLPELSDAEFIRLSKAQVGALVDAIKQDLESLAHEEIGDEDRLTKLETQTQVLAEAVIAITKTDETLAPAISAVKAEMHGPQHSTERRPDTAAVATLDIGGLADIARRVRDTSGDLRSPSLPQSPHQWLHARDVDCHQGFCARPPSGPAP